MNFPDQMTKLKIEEETANGIYFHFNKICHGQWAGNIASQSYGFLVGAQRKKIIS